MTDAHSAENVALQHAPYGITHPNWERPDCFFYETHEKAEEAIRRTYGPGSGHLVVAVLAACEHDWMTFGEAEAAYLQCFLCGRNRDLPTSPGMGSSDGDA